MKLFFCQNDCPIRGEFWQKNIAHILFELCPVQIIITHPLLLTHLLICNSGIWMCINFELSEELEKNPSFQK